MNLLLLSLLALSALAVFQTSAQPLAQRSGGEHFRRVQAADELAQLPPLRQQARELTEWAESRQRDYLPGLMDADGVAVWIVTATEYHEDPAYFAIWPTAGLRNCAAEFGPVGDLDQACLSDQVNTRGVTFTVFARTAGGVARQVFSDHAGRGASAFAELRGYVAAAVGAPRADSIVLNSGRGRFQGLTAGEERHVMGLLGPELGRLVYQPADHGEQLHPLPFRFIEQRVPAMAPRMRQLVGLTHALAAEGFSAAVITPNLTTTEDVNFYLKVRECPPPRRWAIPGAERRSRRHSA
jgi:hypothetical protein